LRHRVSARMRGLLGRLLCLSRPAKRALMISGDLIMIPLALWSALTLRLGSVDHGLHSGGWLYLIAAVTSVPIFGKTGLYRAVLRFIAGRAVVAILAGVSVSVVVSFAVDRLFFGSTIPLSAFVIYLLIAMLYVSGSRTIARHLFDLVTSPKSRVIIYGAGHSGVSLALALRKKRDFEPVAFVDDDVDHHRSVMAGLEVFPPQALESLVDRFGVSRILLALTNCPRSRRREIITELERLDVHVQTMPEISDVVSGRTRVDDLHDIDVSDVLGRDAVPPDKNLLAACITDKSVMVTGAGGSIGSELCRQILRLQPRVLVLFEMSEHALYQIDRELRADPAVLAYTEIVPLLGNASDKQRVRDVLQAFGVQTVYHAAAYKHVPIVEENVAEGIQNNVVATLHTAEAAVEAGVETFVLISTDKAVKPTNVMGATKRVAELVLQALHARSTQTRFCMVRFGNVLDSSGSVVPLFREQILRGGPVTVTHRDVTRYFMTIPEAAQLVIQAGSLGEGGDVFVLDMGQPVRIDDLARRMIALMGLTVRDESNPDGDIEIHYTGLRPGEKLYEELLIGDNATRTTHSMIQRALEHSLPWDRVRKLVTELQEAARSSDCRRAVWLLSEAVAEYEPRELLADRVAIRRAMLPFDKPKTADVTGRVLQIASARGNERA
jgi:UDP-N-acetylglucosamine 4,6-dehydratase